MLYTFIQTRVSLFTLFFISDAPEFVAGQDTINISVISSNNVTLNCVAMANPNIIHLNLTYTSNTANNIDITSSSFVITSATTDNQGSYTCSATNLVAIKQLVYNLIVGGNINNIICPFMYSSVYSSIHSCIHHPLFIFVYIHSYIQLFIHY